MTTTKQLGRNEDIANARLIAAAPDLLEACRAFVACWPRPIGTDMADVRTAYALAEAAIAKATE